MAATHCSLVFSPDSIRARASRGGPCISSGPFVFRGSVFGTRPPSSIGGIPGRYSHINFVFGSWYSTGQRRASSNCASSRFVSLLMFGSRKAAAIAALLSGKKCVDGNGGSCALAALANTMTMKAAALEQAWRGIAENPLFQQRRPLYVRRTDDPTCPMQEDWGDLVFRTVSNHRLKKRRLPENGGTAAPSDLTFLALLLKKALEGHIANLGRVRSWPPRSSPISILSPRPKSSRTASASLSGKRIRCVSVSTLRLPSPHLHGKASPPMQKKRSPSSSIVRHAGGPRLPRRRPPIGYTTAGQRLPLLAAELACGDTNSCGTNLPLFCSSP
jgi:hypothetical protein